MASLEEHLLNINVVLIAVGAWFILWVLRKVWKGMDSIKIVKRLKPVYPAILCQAFVWIPGALPAEPEPTVGSRILMALWCGFLASIGYQLLKRFMGERGIQLPDKPEDLLPNSDTEDDKPEPDGEEDEEDADAADEPEDKESRVTPIETPVPKKVAEAEADGGSGSDGDDSDSDDD